MSEARTKENKARRMAKQARLKGKSMRTPRGTARALRRHERD